MQQIKYCFVIIIQWYQDLNDEDLSKVPKILVGNEIEKRDPSNPNHIK